MKIVVVGAGPAGLAAASAATDAGAQVKMVDDNPSPGGQIWRGSSGDWLARLQRAGIGPYFGSRVISATPGELIVEDAERAFLLQFDRLIVATGARELFLPFPGWTLPGVMGAGGLQALVKSGMPINGKRVVVAGSGPLLLAVAAHLKKCGAEVTAVLEQSSWKRLAHFAMQLPWSKGLEAVRLWNTTYSPNAWVEAAHGDKSLERVTVRSSRSTRRIDCDFLAVSYGLHPNDELLQLLGWDRGRLDAFQQTSVPNIYAAGEVTGIGGAEVSQVEGEIAGYAAAGDLANARSRFKARARWKQFVSGMAQAFATRPEIMQLARPDTLVCRCEDVSLGRLREFGNWREAKLQTRCGMGPCQGRVCGPALRTLLGWEADAVRPPIFPARLGSLACEMENGE